MITTPLFPADRSVVADWFPHAEATGAGRYLRDLVAWREHDIRNLHPVYLPGGRVTRNYCPPGSGMGAVTEHYVASDGNDSNDGLTWSNRKATIESALQSCNDATNGDRLNIAGSFTLSANIDVAAQLPRTPTGAAPIIMQGMTAGGSPADGGLATLDRNGGARVLDSVNLDFVALIDLRFLNSTSDAVLLDNQIFIYHCESDVTSNDGFHVDIDCFIARCRIAPSGTGIRISNEAFVTDNVVQCQIRGASSGTIRNNLCYHTGTGAIITIAGSGSYGQISNNSILNGGAAAGASGILLPAAGNLLFSVTNNVIEGFTDATGIKQPSVPSRNVVLDYNAVFNCLTAYDLAAENPLLAVADNETLGSTPFAKGTWPTDFTDANYFADARAFFAPNDVGNVRTGGFPSGSNMFKGAVRPVIPTPGASARRPRAKILTN